MGETAPAARRTGSARRLIRQIGPVRLLVTLLLLAGALYVARYSWSLPLIGDGERALYDLRFVQAAERTQDQDPRITLVTYTDETLIKLEKRSPLDRATLTLALRVLDAMNPKAIGIDILFDQPQAEDEELIAALRAMRTPTYIAFSTAELTENDMIWEQEQFLRRFLASANTDKVSPASIIMDADVQDGVVRRWPERYPGMPLFLSNALAPEFSAMTSYRGAIDYQIPASQEVPVFAELPIEALAELGDLPSDMLQQAVADPLLRNQFEGRYVLIGGNIKGFDQKETPITRVTGAPMSGLEVHAHMLRQLLDSHAPAGLPPWLLWLAALTVVLAAALTGLLELRSWVVVPALLIQFGAIAFLPFVLEAQDVGTLDLPAAGWIGGWVMAFLGTALAARAIGSEQRRFAHSALGKYLPADVANEIMRDPDRLDLSGEKKYIYALFTDLEGFTKLSHAIEPEQLSILLNRYLDTMSDTVLAHGGTIDKFVGDAVVAFWGAPLARPDDAERAVKAAIAMYEAGEEFRRSADTALPPIGRTRVGLHKGEAVVGNFGGEKRIQYTALGDGMNTAARLESANKALKTTILISREAMEDTSLDIFRPMGRIVLSGRATPVEVWEPALGMDSTLRLRLCALWERYESGDDQALAELQQVAAEHSEDAALNFFVERLRGTSPNQAYVLKSK